MTRWGVAIFLSVLSVYAYSPGQDLQGKVVNRIEQPLPGAKVCLLGFVDRCALSDDSGHWSLTIPVGIREGSGSGSDNGFFRIKTSRANLTLESYASVPLFLDWMDVLGRPLAPRGGALPARLFGSWRLDPEILASLPEGMILLRARLGRVQRTVTLMNLRGEVAVIRSPAAKPLAKVAGNIPYYLETSLAGFETGFRIAVAPPETNWMTLTPSGEPRDQRSFYLTAAILSIDRENQHIMVRSSSITCDSGKLIEKMLGGKMTFRLHEGKLYIPRSPDSCRASRFSGNGTDIIGTWTLDDAYAEMPAAYRPAGCPTVLPFSRPPDSGATVTYRFSTTELTLESSEPQCLSDERWFHARNIIMHNDRTVRWVENSCRRTAWVNSAGDSAFQTFQVHGDRDSAKVTFTYKDKSCSFIDDGLFSDPPPSCPDPVEAALDAYLDCIAASGFADIPRPLPKSSARKAGAGILGSAFRDQ